MSNALTFDYTFRFEEDPAHPLHFRIELDPITMVHTRHRDLPLPEWTERRDDLCAHCPSTCHESHCPLAISVAEVTAVFAGHMSYSRVTLEVVTQRRTYTAQTTLQHALGSMLGLYMATSGCPAMAQFKAMARFHMPMADREETVFRSVGAYLIGQYIRARRGEEADLSLEGLHACYERVHTINKAMAERLRSQGPGDANINAIVVLDLLAHELPRSIKEGLDGMLHLYGHLFEPDQDGSA